MGKPIQMKCVVRCEKCGREQGILTIVEYSRADFPKYSRKQFYELGETDYEKFEELIKQSLSCDCDRCKGTARIVEILDMQYIR